MWGKICGMTTPAAVAAALEAGADAIGFVFAESVRRVTPQVAAQLATAARGRVRCVAVIRHATQQEFDLILAEFERFQARWEIGKILLVFVLFGVARDPGAHDESEPQDA